MKLKFVQCKNNKCEVYFKELIVFTIRHIKESDSYWIDTGMINFRFYTMNKSIDLIEPHKYSKTMKEAESNCKKIMYSYINWLTEK